MTIYNHKFQEGKTSQPIGNTRIRCSPPFNPHLPINKSSLKGLLLKVLIGNLNFGDTHLTKL